MVNDLKMTVLVDNIAKDPLKAEWGLSILVEADGKKILLDTGASSAFAENAGQMGIDLHDVKAGVLSHAHYDHSDGLEAFFEKNEQAYFLVREGSCENLFGKDDDGNYKYIGIKQGFLERFADRIRYVSGTFELEEGIWLIPHRKRADYAKIAVRNDLFKSEDGRYLPDDFCHEQSLVIDTAGGLVLFNSCSHAGVANILEDVKEFIGRNDVRTYIGGLHLYLYTDEELYSLCEKLKNAGVDQIYTGHCTGDHAFSLLSSELGSMITQFYSGFSCRLQ